jgi:diguanylate cyclase (GGDEF)-like protein
VRESDLAARLGGDEFVVLCPETAGEGLEVLASGLEECLAQHSIRASVGFAQREAGDIAIADVLGRADRSMYDRKRLRSGHAGLQPEAQALAAA